MTDTSDELQADFIWSTIPLGAIDDHDLTPAQFRVLASLWSFGNPRKNVAFPSVKKLAEIVGITPRAVRIALNKLSERWITITPREGTSNLYRLHMQPKEVKEKDEGVNLDSGGDESTFRGGMNGDSGGDESTFSQTIQLNNTSSTKQKDLSGASAPDQTQDPDDIPRAKNGRKRTDHDDMVDALAWCVHGVYERELIDALSIGAMSNLGRVSKRLRKVGATPADLREWWEWWRQFDWRGQKGQRPKPNQITDSWPAFVEWRKNPSSQPDDNSGKSPLVIAAEKRLRELQKQKGAIDGEFRVCNGDDERVGFGLLPGQTTRV